MRKTSLKSIILLFMVVFTSLSFFACKDEEKEEEKCTICGTNNPLLELEWLKNIVIDINSSSEKAQISVCTYKNNEEGFLISTCVDCPDEGISLMDCQGNYIGTIFGIAGLGYDYYEINESSIKVIYKNF